MTLKIKKKQPIRAQNKKDLGTPFILFKDLTKWFVKCKKCFTNEEFASKTQ